jgi:hypothetical protein
MIVYQMLATNTYWLVCCDFLKFLAMGCFLLPLYLKNVKQHISNFSCLLLCARAIILEFGNFFLKGRGVRNYSIIWSFSWGRVMGVALYF